MFMALCTTILGQESRPIQAKKLDINYNDTITCKLKIIGIKTKNKAYVIDAFDKRNDTYYKLVSFKGKLKKCKIIKVGGEYEFEIWPYFKVKDFVPSQFIDYVTELNGTTIIVPSDERTSNIFLTSDLIGLCYSKRVVDE